MTSERWTRLLEDQRLFGAALLISVVPLWLTPFLPFVDLPQHAALVAGLHGNELNGIYVLAHLARFLRAVAAGERPPLALTGRVIIVPAVNVLGVNLRQRTWPFTDT